MKKLLLALLLAADMVHAGNIATMKNQAGGLIYLTDAKTRDCKDGRAVYATSSSGGSTWGCWFLIDDMIHVAWDTGGTSAFPANAFTLVKKNKGEDL